MRAASLQPAWGQLAPVHLHDPLQGCPGSCLLALHGQVVGGLGQPGVGQQQQQQGQGGCTQQPSPAPRGQQPPRQQRLRAPLACIMMSGCCSSHDCSTLASGKHANADQARSLNGHALQGVWSVPSVNLAGDQLQRRLAGCWGMLANDVCLHVSSSARTSATVPTVQKPCTATIMMTRWLVGITSMASVKAT